MGLRSRLAVLLWQMLILLWATYIAIGSAYTQELWFIAGLLAVVINPQLLEPFYPRPADVIANTLVFLFLFAVSSHPTTELGWKIAAGALAIAGILALFGFLFRDSVSYRLSAFANAARTISQLATAQSIYSIVFILALVEFSPDLEKSFWVMMSAWLGIMVLGNTNWERIARYSPVSVFDVEGFVGPSTLNVRGPALPRQGALVEVRSQRDTETGVMIRRIARKQDVWGQIHVANLDACESLLKARSVVVRVIDESASCVGTVDVGSNDVSLTFIATRPLAVGQVVGVPHERLASNVLYQLVSANVESTEVKGGSHLFERAKGAQLGVFNRDNLHFTRLPWTSRAGSPVVTELDDQDLHNLATPEEYELLGHVIGTDYPIFLDILAASTGHLAILGMTKMGKSTLTERLARRMAQTRNVTILDLTGEYVSKKRLPKYDKDTELNVPGVSVYEPLPGQVPAERAESFLKYLMDQAEPEYQTGDPFPRTVIIDEAHQFIPEPAGLGFNAPGRDSSFRIGLMLMQVRKFGISVILISQRTAVVAKSALSQCENLVAFRSVDQTGLDYLESLAGGDVRLILPRLDQGEALVFGPAVTSDLPVAVKVHVQ